MNTDTQNQAVFDLDKAVNARVADYNTEQAKKQAQYDAQRDEEVATRRAECEQALAKAFPAELREALDMTVDEYSVMRDNGYAANGHLQALFTLEDHRWLIMLEYGSGIYINAPDGLSKQTGHNDENVDTLLLEIGLWREREAERARKEQAEKEAQARLIEEKTAADAQKPANEPAQPRMVGDPDDTNVVYVLSERVSHYGVGLVQTQAKFGYGEVYLVTIDGTSKPHRFALTTEQLDALIAARALYQQHLEAVKQRREAAKAADPNEVPF